MNPEILNLYLNVAGDYERFIGDLRAKLADHPQRLNYIDKYGDWLREHPLLPEQRAIQPRRWIHINLIVQDEDGVETMRTTIAVRDDNVYFMGFKNLNGDWYEFGIEGKSMRFIAGSTFLGCDVSYQDLLGGQAINLGMEDAISTVGALCRYRAGTANVATKRHLARVCVMICESARMTPHYERVRDGWNVGGTIDPLHVVRYVNKWAQISRALINHADRYPENLDRQGALDVVKLMLNSSRLPVGPQRHLSSQQGLSSSLGPAPSSSSGGGGTQEQGPTVRGRPLLEVFAVYIYPGAAIDTIIVYDGKRGQIIYKHDQGRNLRPNYKLALTGPHRAISADGSFAIQVISKTGTSDQVIGEMFWDCYADDDLVYDKVLTGDMISTSDGHLAEVSYVVWSDAVKATVEVNLLLPAGVTHVHGQITAHYPSLDYENVVLFSRELDEKVELVRHSSFKSMVPLELGRSVIAVPVLSRYSGLWIDVQLHSNEEEGGALLAGCVGFYLDKHTGEIRSKQSGDFFVPTGVSTSHGSHTSVTCQGTQQTSLQQVKVQVNITAPGFHVSPLKPESLEHMGIGLSVSSFWF